MLRGDSYRSTIISLWSDDFFSRLVSLDISVLLSNVYVTSSSVPLIDPASFNSWMSRLSPKSVSVLSTWLDSQDLLATDESGQHGPWKAVEAAWQAWDTYLKAERVVDQSWRRYQQAEADPAVAQAYKAYQQEKEKAREAVQQAYAAYQQEKEKAREAANQAYETYSQAREAAHQAYKTYSQAREAHFNPNQARQTRNECQGPKRTARQKAFYIAFQKPRRRKASQVQVAQVQNASSWDLRQTPTHMMLGLTQF